MATANKSGLAQIVLWFAAAVAAGVASSSLPSCKMPTIPIAKGIPGPTGPQGPPGPVGPQGPPGENATPLPTPPNPAPNPVPAPQTEPITGTIHVTLVWAPLEVDKVTVDFVIDAAWRRKMTAAGCEVRVFDADDPEVTRLGFRPTIETTLIPLVIFQDSAGKIRGALHKPTTAEVTVFIAKLRGGP